MKSKLLLVVLATAVLIGCQGKETPEKAAPPQATIPEASNTITTTGYTVRLHVSGIIHLIGKKGDTTRELLVPNLTAANPKHTPLLLATSDYMPYNLPYEGEQTPIDYPQSPKKKFMYAELTPGYEIDLQKSGLYKSGSLDFNEKDTDKDGKPAECPDPVYTPQRSLYWLPRLSTVAGANNFVIKQTFQKKDPDAADVVSYMTIDDGALDAVPGSDKFTFSVLGQKKHTQAVAKELVYTFKVGLDNADPVFHLWGRKFGSQDSDYEIARFKPYNNAIEIYLVNSVKDDFFNPKKTDLPHFHLAYGVIGLSSPGTVPLAVAKRGDACGGPVGGSVECGPDTGP